MAPLRPAVLMLLTALTGCGEAQADGWSRVVEIGEAEPFYSIVHADPLTGVCIAVNLRGPSATYVQDDDFDVQITGADVVVWAATGDVTSGQGCTNTTLTAAPTSATGKIEFSDFTNAVQAEAPCSVSFELTIVGFDGQTYEVSERELPILDVGCRRPGRYAGEYTDLRAAYGEYGGVGNLVISSWDEQHQVCVWARFSSADAGPDTSAVDVAGPWVYGGLRFGLMPRDACVASNLVAPPINPPYLTDSASAINSTGSLDFGSTQTREVMGAQIDVPCTIDVGLALQSRGRYYWTPDDVVMNASGVVVAGACD